MECCLRVKNIDSRPSWAKLSTGQISSAKLLEEGGEIRKTGLWRSRLGVYVLAREVINPRTPKLLLRRTMRESSYGPELVSADSVRSRGGM